ncbi:hypothetical protein PG996_007536 [Apiospora saccharicola]|uniref:Uncharacterized protein n=1 Tax=Apiospora saccharicola TaxID=335842 RepID=A0ABR1VB43_9PEZI
MGQKRERGDLRRNEQSNAEAQADVATTQSEAATTAWRKLWDVRPGVGPKTHIKFPSDSKRMRNAKGTWREPWDFLPEKKCGRGLEESLGRSLKAVAARRATTSQLAQGPGMLVKSGWPKPAKSVRNQVGSGVFPQSKKGKDIATEDQMKSVHSKAPLPVQKAQNGESKMIDFIFGVTHTQHL